MAQEGKGEALEELKKVKECAASKEKQKKKTTKDWMFEKLILFLDATKILSKSLKSCWKTQ